METDPISNPHCLGCCLSGGKRGFLVSQSRSEKWTAQGHLHGPLLPVFTPPPLFPAVRSEARLGYLLPTHTSSREAGSPPRILPGLLCSADSKLGDRRSYRAHPGNKAWRRHHSGQSLTVVDSVFSIALSSRRGATGGGPGKRGISRPHPRLRPRCLCWEHTSGSTAPRWPERSWR